MYSTALVSLPGGGVDAHQRLVVVQQFGVDFGPVDGLRLGDRAEDQ
jgi:hypothetical protein